MGKGSGKGASGPKGSTKTGSAHYPPPNVHHEPDEPCCCCATPEDVERRKAKAQGRNFVEDHHVEEATITSQPVSDSKAHELPETKEEEPFETKRMDADFDDDLARYPEPELVIDEVSFPEVMEKQPPAMGIMGFLCCGGQSGFKGVPGQEAPAELPS